jgi:hypothetical protein
MTSHALVADDAALAMRASSWGDVGDYSRLVRARDVASIHSGAGDEPLDLDVFVVGAGGVATDPLPPTPSGSAGALAAIGLAPQYSGKHGGISCRGPRGPPLVVPGSASHGSGFGAVGSPVVVGGSRRHASSTHAPHSIMQLSSSLSSEEGGLHAGEGEGEGDDHISDGDSDSFFARNSEEVARPRVVMPNATAHGVFHGDRSCGDVDVIEDDNWGCGRHAAHGADAHRGKGVYRDDDEDDDDEDDEDDEDDDGSGGGQQIEVRRRQQLSWAVHDVDDDVDEDEDEDDDDDDEPPPLSESDDPGGGGGDDGGGG